MSVPPKKKKLKISLPFGKNLNPNTQTGIANEKQDNLNLDIATNIDLKTKRMKKASLQHCISVMRAEWHKLTIFAPKTFAVDGEKTSPKSRTTLILGR
ncbi:MAG: hypothetical protein RH860_11205 [Cytophagales bacterium]